MRLDILLGLDVLDGDEDLGVLDPLHDLGLAVKETGPASGNNEYVRE